MHTIENSMEVPIIRVEPKEWLIVRDILRRYASGLQVYAYGSRATNRRFKRYSDLDLALSGRPVRLIGDWTLEDALDEARIPFRCDVVILPEVDEAFRKRIEPDLVELKFE